MTGDGSTHRLITAASLVAAGIALGYLLAAVPNVEGISAVSFFAGYRLGARLGCLVGGLTMGLFSLFNPLGPPVPHVLAAQVVGTGIIGASGRLWRELAWRLPLGALLAGAMGAGLTLLALVMADYAFAVSMGKWRDPLPVIVLGLPFSAVRIVSNGLIFGGLGAFLLRRDRLMETGSP
jgi:hypothetical protein